MDFQKLSCDFETLQSTFEGLVDIFVGGLIADTEAPIWSQLKTMNAMQLQVTRHPQRAGLWNQGGNVRHIFKKSCCF